MKVNPVGYFKLLIFDLMLFIRLSFVFACIQSMKAWQSLQDSSEFSFLRFEVENTFGYFHDFEWFISSFDSSNTFYDWTGA